MRSIVLVVALVACGGSTGTGDDGGPGAGPKLIAGGGVANAPIDGTLNVYVVELDSATPIKGATVIASATPMVTDATGLATFRGVTGPQTITASLAGYATATWIGVGGANATIPLERLPHTVPTAHVTGTIAGWNSLPSPPLGHYNLGLVLYSFLDDPSALENSIAQPTSSGAPLDTCLNTGLSSSCAWQLTTRVGLQVHSAVIVEGDPHGTNSDTSDDTYTLIGYAVGAPMTLTAGQQVTGESLAMVSATTPLAVTLPGVPSGLGHLLAIPELALGDAGRIVFPLPTLAPGTTTTRVLTPTGSLAGHYELVALATPSATATTPYSSAFVHDVTATATVPALLAVPTVTATPTTFSFSGGGNFHTAQFTRAGQVLWNVTILDASTSFTVPTGSENVLGTGTTDFKVTTAEVPGFDAAGFDVPAVKKALARASGAQMTFAR